MVLAICFPNALNNIMRWLDAVRSYASISFTLWASPFSRAWKRRVGIWLAGNLRVEVVAEQVASMHRESEKGYSRKPASGVADSRKPVGPE
jgi:hypothetical protein